ncbi:spore germination protein YaaH [Oxalobacteraceae bacterium GrIS 1.18]
MSHEFLNVELTKIIDSLQSRGKQQITGALLGELIRDVAPELDIRSVMGITTGSGVLSKFIARHLSDTLTIIGKQGSDTIYQVNPSVTGHHIDGNREFWRAFVNPQSHNFIVIQDSILQLRAKAGKVENTIDPAIGIESATNSELEEIRLSFALSLGDKSKDLPEIKAPYGEWSFALRKLGGEFTRSWTEYRIQHILNLFELKLEKQGIAPETRTKLREILRRSQLANKAAFSASKSISRTTSNTTSEIKKDILLSESSFRNVIANAIQKLPISDLRELKLPAGLLFDALTDLNKK